MDRRKWILVGVGGAVALVVGGWVFLEHFAPERTTTLDEPEPSGDARLVASGEWSGADRVHKASGSVRVYEVDGRFVLRFEDFQATSGPDVFLYLVKEADASDPEAIEEEGVRILVDGGADGGEATKRGTFNQPVPEGVDPTAFGGLVLWCDAYDVLFGSAPLDFATA